MIRCFSSKNEASFTELSCYNNHNNIGEFDNVYSILYELCVWGEVKDSEEYKAVQGTFDYNGPVLSRSRGTISGPSGKETYYNLNMSGCINIMNSRGFHEPYWVRSDGVKMYGYYVMCAAGLSIRPKGSIVESSNGLAIVVDTGGFASGNPRQLDIAVTW